MMVRPTLDDQSQAPGLVPAAYHLYIPLIGWPLMVCSIEPAGVGWQHNSNNCPFHPPIKDVSLLSWVIPRARPRLTLAVMGHTYIDSPRHLLGVQVVIRHQLISNDQVSRCHDAKASINQCHTRGGDRLEKATAATREHLLSLAGAVTSCQAGTSEAVTGQPGAGGSACDPGQQVA